MQIYLCIKYGPGNPEASCRWVWLPLELHDLLVDMSRRNHFGQHIWMLAAFISSSTALLVCVAQGEEPTQDG